MQKTSLRRRAINSAKIKLTKHMVTSKADQIKTLEAKGYTNVVYSGKQGAFYATKPKN